VVHVQNQVSRAKQNLRKAGESLNQVQLGLHLRHSGKAGRRLPAEANAARLTSMVGRPG